MTLEIDELHHTVETVVNALSILCNCYLLYLIKYYSTFGVKLYQYLLTIDALLDLCLSVAAGLCQAIGMTGDGYYLLMSNGYFSGVLPFLDSLFLILFAFFIHTNVMWVAVQFIYRYRLLCKNQQNTSPRRINFLIGLITVGYSLIALAVILGMCQVREEFQPFGQYVSDLNTWPRRKDGRHIFFVGSYITNWRVITWLSLWSTTCIVSIIIVIWCERRIIEHFKQLGNVTQAATSTQRMHREFHRALLAMAICPLVTTTVPMFYLMGTIVFQVTSGRFMPAIMSSAVTSITLVNPLTTIICFRSYRRVTVNFLTFCRHKNLVIPAQ